MQEESINVGSELDRFAVQFPLGSGEKKDGAKRREPAAQILKTPRHRKRFSMA
jgi:hypothetical protein